jgi:hypothetical protein
MAKEYRKYLEKSNQNLIFVTNFDTQRLSPALILPIKKHKRSIE